MDHRSHLQSSGILPAAQRANSTANVLEAFLHHGTVDADDLPTDVPCGGHCEEGDDAGDFMRLAHALHRRGAADRVVEAFVREKRGRKRRVDKPRGYRIDADSVGAPLACKVACHMLERRLKKATEGEERQRRGEEGP